MTIAGRWYITHHAVERYVFARRWPEDAAHFERAEAELIKLMPTASHRATDKQGRQLWRCPKGTGGLRWVVSLARRAEGDLPQVVWVGFARPPANHWDPEQAGEL